MVSIPFQGIKFFLEPPCFATTARKFPFSPISGFCFKLCCFTPINRDGIYGPQPCRNVNLH